MFTFYYARNTCALASHFALEHACANYEAVRLDFQREEQRQSDYLRLNPKGRVPALVTPRPEARVSVLVVRASVLGMDQPAARAALRVLLDAFRALRVPDVVDGFLFDR